MLARRFRVGLVLTINASLKIHNPAPLKTTKAMRASADVFITLFLLKKTKNKDIANAPKPNATIAPLVSVLNITKKIRSKLTIYQYFQIGFRFPDCFFLKYKNNAINKPKIR